MPNYMALGHCRSPVHVLRYTPDQHNCHLYVTRATKKNSPHYQECVGKYKVIVSRNMPTFYTNLAA